jgi:hypothetical protein
MTSLRQPTLDSHVVSILPEPGLEVGKKVEVTKGWFNYERVAAPKDLGTRVSLLVTAWDVTGTKWDSRQEKKKGTKADLSRFIVHPCINSDEDDPRGYPMCMSDYVSF